MVYDLVSCLWIYVQSSESRV